MTFHSRQWLNLGNILQAPYFQPSIIILPAAAPFHILLNKWPPSIDSKMEFAFVPPSYPSFMDKGVYQSFY